MAAFPIAAALSRIPDHLLDFLAVVALPAH
jgi:hypothetical protein